MDSASVLDLDFAVATAPRPRHPARRAVRPGVTVLVPAYNEAATIGDTIESLLAQSVPAAEIIVIDDCSTDDTAEVARAYDVTVLRLPSNTGSKAGAQNFALAHVTTEFTLAVDADTIVAADAIEKLFAVMNGSDLAAACGFVVPRYVRTVWERGRYVEYLLAFSFYKPIQDYFSKPLISSGCFSIYRTSVLREHGGWQTRTMAEDMDLTWTVYRAGRRVRFVPEAVCYPIEHPSRCSPRRLPRRCCCSVVSSRALNCFAYGRCFAPSRVCARPTPAWCHRSASNRQNRSYHER